MSKPPRIPILLPWDHEVIYHTTFCIEGRKRVLANQSFFNLAIKTLQKIHQNWVVRGGVIMPDHVHFLVSPCDRDKSIGSFSRLFKTLIIKELQPDWKWQGGCFDHLLRSDEKLDQSFDYIRMNPVRAGLVKFPNDWPYQIYPFEQANAACGDTGPTKLDNIPVGIALGSNVGDSSLQIKNAFVWLKSLSINHSILTSSLYHSTPVDCALGTPLFLNAVCELALPPDTDPFELLRKLQEYEISHGRPEDHGINQPRTIDLDIIYFGDSRSNLPALVIPHPRAHLRQFVLEPLAEIRPELILPGQCQSVQTLLERLPEKDPLFKKL